MDFNSTSLEGVLNRLTVALEGLGDGFLEQPAIPYTINQLLETAIDNRASLLHINVGSPPMLRINEQLVPIGDHQLTRGDCQKLLFPLLTREQREALYSGIEIDGCFPASGTGFRLNLYKERGNPGASIRRLRSDISSLASLGLDTETVEQALMERSGLILLTGAPRSGKQSTMAALIAHLNTTRSARIISLERNIQFWHHKSKSTIIQREIGIDTKSFSHGIQQAVLQDPDVIALSELPDRETAEFAIRAAAGGHLVLAAIDASSSVRGLERIIDTFTKSGTNGHKVITSLANSLRLVLAQTLVPRADAQGMLPAFEILTASEAVRRELHEGRAENLSTIMRDENMQTLGKALAYLVSAGTVSRQDALGFVDTLPEIESQPAQPQPSSPAPAAGSSEPTDMLAWL